MFVYINIFIYDLPSNLFLNYYFSYYGSLDLSNKNCQIYVTYKCKKWKKKKVTSIYKAKT